jgi:uncharacterized membrane protein
MLLLKMLTLSMCLIILVTILMSRIQPQHTKMSSVPNRATATEFLGNAAASWASPVKHANALSALKTAMATVFAQRCDRLQKVQASGILVSMPTTRHRVFAMMAGVIQHAIRNSAQANQIQWEDQVEMGRIKTTFPAQRFLALVGVSACMALACVTKAS